MTTQAAWGAIPPDTLAVRLWRARNFAGMNQAELAEAIGASAKTVSRYEDGEQTRRSVVMAWAMATGVNLEWLETGKAPSPTDDGASGDVHPLGLEPRTQCLRATVSLLSDYQRMGAAA